mgnify:CR=1 FL=1
MSSLCGAGRGSEGDGTTTPLPASAMSIPHAGTEQEVKEGKPFFMVSLKRDAGKAARDKAKRLAIGPNHWDHKVPANGT